MTASNIYGRQVVVPLTNKSGGGVIAGDVVVVDTTNNDAFTTTTSAGFTGGVGIAQETIASNASGRVLLSGYAALVLTSASVTRGNFGKTHTVAKQAVDAGATRGVGTFCQFLTGGTTPDAIVYPVDLLGSSLTNPMTTKGDIIQGDTGGTPVRLGAGTSGYLLTAGGAAAFSAWAAPVTGNYFVNQLAADVNIAAANTYYTGPSITLSVGTWLLTGVVTCRATAGVAGKFFTKLWDGTTVAASAQGESDETTAVGTNAIPLTGVAVIVSGTPTWKISVAADGGGAQANILAAMTANGAGNNASTLVAVRIA